MKQESKATVFWRQVLARAQKERLGALLGELERHEGGNERYAASLQCAPLDLPSLLRLPPHHHMLSRDCLNSCCISLEPFVVGPIKGLLGP